MRTGKLVERRVDSTATFCPFSGHIEWCIVIRTEPLPPLVLFLVRFAEIMNGVERRIGGGGVSTNIELIPAHLAT
jgi:hypothetical protein